MPPPRRIWTERSLPTAFRRITLRLARLIRAARVNRPAAALLLVTGLVLVGTHSTSRAAVSQQTPQADDTAAQAPDPLPPIGKSSPGCVAAQYVPQTTREAVCIHAHVYDIVETEDGSRFLDVCPPGLPDDECRFTVVTLPIDRRDVGNLHTLLDRDIFLWGKIIHLHQRLGISLSHRRQFAGGPEKFRPNPRLLTAFDAESAHNAFRDPNLQSSSHARSFMNNRLQEPVPTPIK